VEAPAVDDSSDILSALLDDLSPAAIEDLADMPIPPAGLWDPTFDPVPDPPPLPLRWRIYFATESDRDRAAVAIRRECPHLSVGASDVDDEDWAARSQAALSAVHAGRFIVAPPWDLPRSVPDGRTLIVIEPSMGFGTGHHATTRLCLQLLSDIDVRGKRVLDIGTGSGVLAMAAALGGAAEVLGLDVDAHAITAALASAAMNPLPPIIRFEVGDFRTAPPAPADVVLANLTGGMLRSTASQLARLEAPGGRLILSGFDLSQVDAVCAAFADLSEVRRLEEEGWVALELR
jgi:ribosomal protein L11 methyltransferase